MSHQWMKIVLSRFPSPDAIELLRRLEVRYVVLHLGAFRAPALSRALSGLESHRAAFLPIRDFGEQTVYEVLPDLRGTSTENFPLEPLQSAGSPPVLFDGVVSESVPGAGAESPGRELAIDLELESPTTVGGFRFHYGPIPRAPVTGIEVLVEEGEGFRTHQTAGPEWPAVTDLVMGLLETPLDGTQTFTVRPVETRRLRLRLTGIDRTLPDVTEIEVLGIAKTSSQISRVNTGN